MIQQMDHTSRIAHRLREARHRRFVGRTAERELIRAALAAPELPFYILCIHGPGGVGKTTLLHEFAYICSQADLPTAFLDGQDIEPTPPAFTAALQRCLGLEPADSPLEFLTALPHRTVFLIDTYERLTPLDSWLRQNFFPFLSEQVLTVLAGRDPLSLAWQRDPGWQMLTHNLPVRNLTSDESRDYLTKRSVPLDQHHNVLSFTHGHPLALSLLADVFDQRPDFQFQPTAAPDTIKILLDNFLQKVPGPAHRTALEACAVVRVTTENLLAEMLALPPPSKTTPVTDSEQPNVTPEIHKVFDWLRGLSFIESKLDGLVLHDLVQKALTADLRWRNPDRYAELHDRARNFYTTRLQQAADPEQQRTLLDYIYLHRDNPIVQPFFEWQTDETLTDVMHDSDIPALLAMVTEHEGQESSRLAAHWLAKQPSGVLVLRNVEGQISGFLARVALHQAGLEEIQLDPATQVAWNYLQAHTPLRPGEGAVHFRFWMARDSYQAISPIQSLLGIHIVRYYLTTPGLAFTFFPCADPDFWAPLCAYANLTRIPELDFEVGGRRYGVYGHDWRVVPPLDWLALLAERETALTSRITPPQPVSEPLVVLSQPDFEAAVRDAFQQLRAARPGALEPNPLLRSRLVLRRAGLNAKEAERAAALQALLQEATTSLQNSPRRAKFYPPLYHTYLKPALTQEQAAELLDLPFSTFRRHLKTGVQHVTEILWQQEING